jgi:hypothetical protein
VPACQWGPRTVGPDLWICEDASRYHRRPRRRHGTACSRSSTSTPFEPGADWLAPLPKLAAKLPGLDRACWQCTIVGDLRTTWRRSSGALEDLLPPGMLTLFGKESGEAARRAEFAGKQQFQRANASARVKWLDGQGIAIQNVICLSGIAYNLLLPELLLRQEVLRTCNRWLAETCACAPGRLLPVTALDYEDLDFAVAELEQMRRLGSRIFLVPAYPVKGVPPAHPGWDRVWSAAVALGMTPMLHTGFERMRFDLANQAATTCCARSAARTGTSPR